MQVEQTLASGLTIRQDFRDSVRFALLETDVVDWRYATKGGTVFIVNFRGECFGVTCRHTVQGVEGFDWRQLSLTDERFGKNIAGISAVYYPSAPEDAAVGSDILDLAVIRFTSDVGPAFFHDQAYIIDQNTIGTSRSGDLIYANGNLKDPTTIDGDEIKAVFALLNFLDAGQSTTDVVLRTAIAKYDRPEFTRITGLSGAPVFNQTLGRLCGMVVRGGMTNDNVTIHYIDIADIVQVLNAVHAGADLARYEKRVSRRS